MFKSKNWFGGGIWKPKNPHSLEHLKYLHGLLSKNQSVSDDNKGLLVETLRCIAEILIWGDQNDSTVFDFFLEKNMLSFFLKIMKQKCGRYVCIQLLQTLNILFENIRNETSLYYLLSNNHVNSIIVHKFDFSDEEVMAYYISFLKTLSLKLNTHTVHFFYNEHTNDFPLYTEAIKFFNHSESMVRIAVRTLTLNVYKVQNNSMLKFIRDTFLFPVQDNSMLKFIRDKTAAPYFSNLVWFIGNHVLELDACIRNDADHQSRNRLSALVAEHLDHLHYLNDILMLQIEALNEVLTDHLLNRLLIPLYVYSLTKRRRHSQIEDDKPHVSSVVSLFLLSQVFLIITHKPLVRQLADIILNRDLSIFSERSNIHHLSSMCQTIGRPGFVAPSESLEKSLESKLQQTWTSASSHDLGVVDEREEEAVAAATLAEAQNAGADVAAAAVDSDPCSNPSGVEEGEVATAEEAGVAVTEPSTATDDDENNVFLNFTDEEKQLHVQVVRGLATELQHASLEQLQESFSLANRPYLEATFNALECSENDYAALFGLCLLYALGDNQGVNQHLLDVVFIPTDRSETKQWYNTNLIERLIRIITISCQYNSKVRLTTLEMSLVLLKKMVLKNGHSFLQDRHLAAIEGAREESTLLLRNFYKSEEIFLDMFEDEHREMHKKPLNVEYLTMDSNILLPPTGTPLTGIEFSKRLPCGEVERARRAIRVFFLLRDLSLTLRKETETQLPLTNPNHCIQVKEVLDLNNSDLIACTVISKVGQKIRRFLVIDVTQLILVEPDSKRLGWGVAKFVGFLQDIEVSGDKDDSRCLHVTIHSPLSSSTPNRIPLLSAKFIFDDHIRCMAAKQRLTKGRLKARQRKMHQIAKLLELPGHVQPCPSPPAHVLQGLRHQDIHRRIGAAARGIPQESGSRSRGVSLGGSGSSHKPMFVTNHKVPGFAAMMRRDEVGAAPSAASSRSASSERRRRSSSSPSQQPPKAGDSSEEIPLEDIFPGRGGSSSPGASPRIKRSSMSHPQGFSWSGGSGSPSRRLSGSMTKTVSAGEHQYDLDPGAAPKSLRKAEAPSTSLLQSEEMTGASGMSTPCFVPVPPPPMPTFTQTGTTKMASVGRSGSRDPIADGGI